MSDVNDHLSKKHDPNSVRKKTVKSMLVTYSTNNSYMMIHSTQAYFKKA